MSDDTVPKRMQKTFSMPQYATGEARVETALFAALLQNAVTPPDWEQCDSCGGLYPDVYWADDEQWAQVVGDEFGGLRCPECFKAEAWAQGLQPVLRFLAPPLGHITRGS